MVIVRSDPTCPADYPEPEVSAEIAVENGVTTPAERL